MFDSSPITILFRFINFAALLGLFFYLFKRYVKNQAEEKINQKEALLKGLEERGYVLEGKEQQLAERLRIQELQSRTLTERIEEWRAALAIENKKKEQELLHAAGLIEKRIICKDAYLARESLNQMVTEQAVRQAGSQLKQYFSQEDKGRAYVHDIVQRLAQEHRS